MGLLSETLSGLFSDTCWEAVAVGRHPLCQTGFLLVMPVTPAARMRRKTKKITIHGSFLYETSVFSEYRNIYFCHWGPPHHHPPSVPCLALPIQPQRERDQWSRRAPRAPLQPEPTAPCSHRCLFIITPVFSCPQLRLIEIQLCERLISISVNLRLPLEFHKFSFATRGLWESALFFSFYFLCFFCFASFSSRIWLFEGWGDVGNVAFAGRNNYTTRLCSLSLKTLRDVWRSNPNWNPSYSNKATRAEWNNCNIIGLYFFYYWTLLLFLSIVTWVFCLSDSVQTL